MMTKLLLFVETAGCVFKQRFPSPWPTQSHFQPHSDLPGVGARQQVRTDALWEGSTMFASALLLLG